MSHNNNNSNTKKKNQVSNVERRTWDVDAYEQKALTRQQQQQQQQRNDGNNDTNTSNVLPISSSSGSSTTTTTKEEFIAAPIGSIGPEGSQRAFLQARKRKVKDIDERIGTTTFISIDDAVGTKKNDDSNLNSIGTSSGSSNVTIPDPTTIKITDGIVKSSGIGFHCSVCDCYLKDSLTYLDHINGRKHQRKLGYTMRVERSTESDVLSKLEELKKQKQQQSSSNNTIGENGITTTIDYNKLVQERDLDEERRKDERQRLRKERRKRSKGERDTTPIDDDNDNDDVVDNENEDGDGDVEHEPQVDPAIAAMMGFSGFGGKT